MFNPSDLSSLLILSQSQIPPKIISCANSVQKKSSTTKLLWRTTSTFQACLLECGHFLARNQWICSQKLPTWNNSCSFSITLPHFQSEISLIDSTQRWVPINSRKGMPAVPIGVDMPMGDRRPIGVRRPMGVRRPKDKISRSRVAFTENEAVLYWVNSLLQQWWFSASKKDRCYYKSGVVSHWKWNHWRFNSQS